MDIKTVVIVNDFNYIQGGASKVAIDTAKLLNKNNLNVYFFSAVNNEKEKIEGITYISTNQNEALKEKNKIKGAINGIYNFKARRGLRKLLKKLNPENTVIHIHGWTKALSSSVFDIAFRMKFKVIVTLHDYFTACPNGGYFNYNQNQICNLQPLKWKCIKCNCDSRNYGFKLYRVVRQFVQNKIVKLNNKLEYAISISNLSEEVLKQTLGKNTKITRIYNPIEINKNEIKRDFSKNDYYLYVGRVSKEKGVDIFCKAITELGCRGIVVGDGDEKGNLQEQFSNIEFVGWKDEDEVKLYMKNARALIFPSRWYETAGLTILEAHSLGTPCLVSENCAGREFISEGKNGLLFKDIGDLKVKINELDDISFEDFNINKFNKERYVEEIIKLYNQIL